MISVETRSQSQPMIANYKGRLARLVWNGGACEVFGKVLEHTEVFIYECRWGDLSGLDPEGPPADLLLQFYSDESLAVVPTSFLGRKGILVLLTSPAQVRIEQSPEPLLAQCDMPCRLQTSERIPLVVEGRCVMLSASGLVDFTAEPLKPRQPVIAELGLGRGQSLTLPGRVDLVRSVGSSHHRMRVEFDNLDRLTAGRLRSLAQSLS
jgi:hypothetical protein